MLGIVEAQSAQCVRRSTRKGSVAELNTGVCEAPVKTHPPPGSRRQGCGRHGGVAVNDTPPREVLF